MKVIDISITIKPGMMAYPKNPEVSFESIETGHSTISKITLGTHTGTHVDAPRHVSKEGAGIDSMDLISFVGPCKVLDFTKSDTSVSKSDLKQHEIRQGERLLLKTQNSYRGFEEFTENYIFLEGDAAEYLAAKNISLIGVDYLSIKKPGDVDNRPHTEFLKKGIPIFEGLDLSKVSAGEYLFVGLPLKLFELDGAPARAVLIADY